MQAVTGSLPRKAWRCIMAGCKQVRRRETPPGRSMSSTADPASIYGEHPAWSFAACDTEQWSFTEEHAGPVFWGEIFPFLKELERRTWGETLLGAKKQNHTIDAAQLNPAAQKRLTERYIEQESVVSLRLAGTKRLYGYHVGRVFCILWYDDGHGDNESCVCRARKKHT